MSSGGRRNGSGRKKSGAAKARAWFRSLVDDEDRRKQFLAALDFDLKNGKVDSFFKAVEHGYGRPPQSLDLNVTRETHVHVAEFAGGETVQIAAPAGLPN